MFFCQIAKAIQPLLQDALNFIQTPAPLSQAVITYEAALTRVPSPTITLTPSITSYPFQHLPANSDSFADAYPFDYPDTLDYSHPV